MLHNMPSGGSGLLLLFLALCQLIDLSVRSDESTEEGADVDPSLDRSLRPDTGTTCLSHRSWVFF